MRKLQPSTTAVKKFFSSALNQPPTATAILAAAILLCALIAANHRAAADFFKVSAAPTASTAPKPQGCCGAVQPTPRRMIGTYYNTGNEMTSTLTLNNKGPQPIAVTPILYNPDGKRFIGSPVTVAGESSQNVELGVLAAVAGPDFRAGSFEFSYEGRLLEMGGGLRIMDEAKSLIFDEQMLEPGMKFSSPRMEAVYSIPFDSAEVSVILSNKTDQVVAVTGDAGFAAANGHHPINGFLKPRQTSVVKLPQGLVKNSKAGAISLSHDGGAGALLAMIHVQDAGRGYSESVNFSDPAQGKTTELHGAGLRLGSVNGDKLVPVIAVRNLGRRDTVVTGRVPFTNANGSEGKVELRKTELAGGEIKLIAVSGIPGSNIATAGLELEYEGAPGSVIADALSVSASGNQVFTLPLKDPQGGLSSTGGYPWFINGTSSTVVFIKNTTKEPQQFHLDIVYSGGRWGSNLKTLAAGQTMAFDVRKIRDSQEKGAGGSVMPADAAVGHIAWSLRGRQNKTLIGRAQTVDLAKALASTYECQCSCGSSFYDSQLLPGYITGFPGDTQQFTAQEQDVNCFGGNYTWYDLPSYSVSFSIGNPSVATIDPYGLATAIAPGSTLIDAGWQTAGIWHKDANGECWLEQRSTDCSASCDVQLPTISIASVTWNHLEIHLNETATLTVQLSVPTEAAGKTINVSISQAATTGTITGYTGSDGKSLGLVLTSPGNIITHNITNSGASNNGTVTFNASLTDPNTPQQVRIGGSNPATSTSITLKPVN